MHIKLGGFCFGMAREIALFLRVKSPCHISLEFWLFKCAQAYCINLRQKILVHLMMFKIRLVGERYEKMVLNWPIRSKV
jgi:hypothetical protein